MLRVTRQLRPLIQIAFGALAGLAPQLKIDLDADVFFLLLVPPLLFLGGWRIQANELIRDQWKILYELVPGDWVVR